MKRNLVVQGFSAELLRGFMLSQVQESGTIDDEKFGIIDIYLPAQVMTHRVE